MEKLEKIIVPADDMGVVEHTQKTITPMSSVKWKKQKNAEVPCHL